MSSPPIVIEKTLRTPREPRVNNKNMVYNIKRLEKLMGDINAKAACKIVINTLFDLKRRGEEIQRLSFRIHLVKGRKSFSKSNVYDIEELFELLKELEEFQGKDCLVNLFNIGIITSKGIYYLLDDGAGPWGMTFLPLK